MIEAVYERRKSGIFRDGRRVFSSGALRSSSVPLGVDGTPWVLHHHNLDALGGEPPATYGYELRLTNIERATLRFHVYVTEHLAFIRFAGLAAPHLRTEGTRHRLYEDAAMVAELVVSWRDDDAAGILARVVTILPAPAGDAAALLLFRLESLHHVGVGGTSDEPLGF